MKFKFVVFILLLFMSCAPKVKERLKNRNLFGQHSLVMIESFNSVQGAVSGKFFLGTGAITGAVRSEYKLQFYWSPKPNEVIASSLPYSKFRFIIDDKLDSPTIEFVFSDVWLNRFTNNDYGNLNRYPNLNCFVLSDVLLLVKVRISKASLEKEVYLPKIR